MIKLIKLEWKKYNNGNGLITAALIMTAILALFIVGTAGELHSAETVEIYGKSMIDAAVDIFTHISYIIFTGVMLAIFLVGAYEKRFSQKVSEPIGISAADRCVKDFVVSRTA